MKRQLALNPKIDARTIQEKGATMKKIEAGANEPGSWRGRPWPWEQRLWEAC
jgi:hypothetical protein